MVRKAYGPAMLAVSISLLLSGCTAVATSDDGSVALGDIAVERVALLPDEVPETSGLANIDGRLWTINDSGNDAALFQLGEDGRGLGKVLYLAGADNVDWEALASDDDWLYIGDSGNNSGRRGQLDLYRVALSQLSAPDGSRIDYSRAHFRYGDRLEVVASRDHNYDSEALTVVDGRLWLFTKNRGDGRSSLYRLDPDATEQTVFPVASYPVDGLITGADFDPGSRRLALLGYSRERVFGQSFLWLVPVPGELPDWSMAKRYRLGIYSQWEGISWDGPDRLLVTTERNPLGDAALAEIRLDRDGEPRAASQATRDLW